MPLDTLYRLPQTPCSAMLMVLFEKADSILLMSSVKTGIVSTVFLRIMFLFVFIAGRTFLIKEVLYMFCEGTGKYLIL